VRILALLPLLLSSISSTAAPVCPAGAAVAYFRLEARRPNAAFPIPIDRVNRLRKGDSIIFYPSDPPVPTNLAPARVALLLLTPATGELRLLESKKATGRQEWVLPDDAEAIAVAYGPRGLDEDRMRQAATKDPELIAHLADYSEKTAQTELVLSALSGRRHNDDRAVDAALLGLAGTGTAARLDRNGSLDQQTLTLIRTLNPAIGSYDPLAPESQQRWQQSATLAASVAGLFFGNTVGLAGSGAALFLNLRSLAFPRTELRSALLREAPEPALCAAKATASRTRFAYLWARRLPLGNAPSIQLAQPALLGIGLSATLHVDGSDADLAAAGRAFRWRLVSPHGNSVPVSVTVPAGEKSLRIAPLPKSIQPGTYRLAADWDWTTVELAADIPVHRLPGLQRLRLTTDTADRLVAGAGAVRAKLAGEPAFFIDSLQLLRLGDPLATPQKLHFAAAPNGDWVEFEVNTANLAAGPYTLSITQRGGAKAELAIAIQPPAPAIANLPLALHRGETRTLQLTGDRLERIERIRSPQARISWNPAKREARLTIPVLAPAVIDLELDVEGRHLPLHLPAAIRALAPKPVIQSVTQAPQEPASVERRTGEIDASLPAAFSLQLDQLPPGAASLVLSCLESGLTPPPAISKPVGPAALYITVPANAPPGCTLRASVAGSEPALLGKLVALPSIRDFTLTGDPAAEPDTYKGSLRGTGLEAIGRTGWSGHASRAVAALPSVDATGQRLDILMPWPAPAPRAPLRIWLRGEEDSRATTARF
jgi:hypothetical protein